MVAASPKQYKLLTAFQNLFRGSKYIHRDATLGNYVARHLYEDLFALGHSAMFNQRVRNGVGVVNVGGATRGVKARRGDGTFGTIVPNSTPKSDPQFNVSTGMVALTQVGTEVKILAKSQLKQIDRVMNDLRGSAASIRTKSANAITVGIAAVNYTESYTGYEGERAFPRDRKPEAALREAEEVARRLDHRIRPAFDEFLLLKFRATNRPPFPFSWLNGPGVAADYGAALVRVAALYEERF